MRKLLGIGAIVLGVVGTLLCAAAIGLGWRVAGRTVDRVERVAARLDQGLSEADERLAGVQGRVNAVRADIDEVRGAAQAIAAENPELPRVRAEVERLLDRLVPALDRVDATASSLQSVAAGLRAAADIVNQFDDDPDTTVRVRTVADAIDRAAVALNAPRAKVDAVKSARAVQMTQKLVTLAREAVAGSDLLAEALVGCRREVTVARERTVEYRDAVVFRVRVAAVAHTVFWLWGGLGQLCLIGWGRRRMSNRVPATS